MARLSRPLNLAEAVASVVLGVMIVAWPGATLHVGAVLFGIWLLVHGIVDIVQAVTWAEADGATRALNAVIGVLFVIAGVICLRNVLISLLTIATVIGVTLLIRGLVRLAAAFSTLLTGPERMLVGTLGALLVLSSLIVLLWPGLTLLALVYVTGIVLIATGIAQFVVELRVRPDVPH